MVESVWEVLTRKERVGAAIMWHKNQELLAEHNNKTGQNIIIKESELYANRK